MYHAIADIANNLCNKRAFLWNKLHENCIKINNRMVYVDFF